jgi:hypothetical protein
MYMYKDKQSTDLSVFDDNEALTNNSDIRKILDPSHYSTDIKLA